MRNDGSSQPWWRRLLVTYWYVAAAVWGFGAWWAFENGFPGGGVVFLALTTAYLLLIYWPPIREWLDDQPWVRSMFPRF